MMAPSARHALYLPPGTYTATSDTPDYARLAALCALGKARAVAVRYLPDGRKALACEVGSRKRNAADGGGHHMTISPEFFSGALNDYENWPIKWWREAVQNAVDARAANVALAVNDMGDEVLVSCDDDGIGMDRQTLIDKFLSLGASGKRGDAGAKGGFGKAKEMLLLPWRRWTVETRDTRVSGVGISYSVETIPFRKGTRLEVAMPADKATSLDLAVEFLDRCHLPNVTFHLSSYFVSTAEETRFTKRAAAKPGKFLREIGGKARLYHDKKAARGCLIRTGGLWMHSRWVPDEVEGLIVVELTGPSIELLSANRDSIRDWNLMRGLDAFIGELSADTKSALREKDKSRKVYSGAGKFQAKPPAAIEADLLAASTGAVETAQVVSRGEMRLDATVVRRLAEALGLNVNATEAQLGSGTVHVGAAPAAVAATVLANTTVRGQEHVERALRQLAWQPDFLVVNNRMGGWKPPAGMLPERMNRKALHLAKVWTELCRFVLIALGSDSRFGVGWIFDPQVGAQYDREGDAHWLLLQPYRRDTDADVLLDPRDPAQLAYLVACAIHEVTHMADGVVLHNEAFAGAMTRNVARCAAVWPVAPLLVEALSRADVDLSRALDVAPAGPPRGRRDAPKPKVVERVVEKIVERPVEVERIVYRDPPPPLPWYAQPVAATGAERELVLSAPARRARPAPQPSLGLKYNGRRAR